MLLSLRLIPTAIVAFGLFASYAASSVHAQSNAPPAGSPPVNTPPANTAPAIAPSPRLTLTAEQEYIIREIIFKDSTVQKESAAPDTIGDVVPDGVKLHPIPPEVTQKVPQARSHMFFIKNDEIVLVSSSDRRVADVIKKKPTD
jgi:hypothetical protein